MPSQESKFSARGLGPLTAHSWQGLARPQSPQGAGRKARPSALSAPLSAACLPPAGAGQGRAGLCQHGRFGGAAEEGPHSCEGRKEPPPGGAPRLGGSGWGLRAAGPDFLSWAPPRHPSPGWVLAGDGARAQGLRSGRTPSSFPGLRRIKQTGSPTQLPSPAPGAPPGEQKRVATSGTMAALSLWLLAVPGPGQPRTWALGLSSAFGR